MKIQFGCGGNILDGFKNHDMDVDVQKLPLPYADNVADFVFLEHLLEHNTAKQALNLLDDIYRILKPGGKVRVCCPVLDRLTPEESRGIILGHGHEIFFSTHSLISFIKTAGFKNVAQTGRMSIDGHHKVIGKALDDKETARIEGTK